MKITLIGYGTRGDVQPYLSLAHALQQRGHEVLLLAPENYASWIAKAGVPFAAIPVDVPAMMAEDAAQRMLAAGDIGSFFKWLGEQERQHDAGIQRSLLAACEGAELIVSHSLMENRAAAISAAKQIPLLPSYFYPVLASREFANPFITTRNLGFLNPATHALFHSVMWKSAAPAIQAMRRELGQPPAEGLLLRQVRRRQLPALMAYDDVLHPRPADWGAHAVVTGGWDMPAELRALVGEAAPDAALEAFLAAGPPPVFLGFGSMPVLNGAEMLATVKRAVEASGQRAVLAAGWSQLEDLSDERLHVVGTVDHDALLPRCSAAVHHGGAGTTRASLKAGLPTWICAVFADQPFWGARCQALGVGGTFPFPKLEAGRLTEALRHLADPTVRANAAKLGEKLRAVDGLSRAVETIETAKVAVI